MTRYTRIEWKCCSVNCHSGKCPVDNDTNRDATIRERDTSGCILDRLEGRNIFVRGEPLKCHAPSLSIFRWKH